MHDPSLAKIHRAIELLKDLRVSEKLLHGARGLTPAK